MYSCIDSTTFTYYLSFTKAQFFIFFLFFKNMLTHCPSQFYYDPLSIDPFQLEIQQNLLYQQQQERTMWNLHLEQLKRDWYTQEQNRMPITKRIRNPLPICDDLEEDLTPVDSSQVNPQAKNLPKKKKKKKKKKKTPPHDVITIIAPKNSKHTAEDLATYEVINRVVASAVQFLYGLIWIRNDLVIMKKLVPKAASKLELLQGKVNNFCDKRSEKSTYKDCLTDLQALKCEILKGSERRQKYVQFFRIVSVLEFLHEACDIGILYSSITQDCSNDIAQRYVPIFLAKCHLCCKEKRKTCVSPEESSLLDKCVFTDILDPSMKKTNCRRENTDLLLN